jgi:hypothetical protein
MELKQVRRAVGAFMLADGIRAFLAPSACARRLEFGNPYIDDVLEYFAENPGLVRGFSVAEIAVGIWLALR